MSGYQVKTPHLDKNLVLQQTNILDFAAQYTELTRKGAEHKGLCPLPGHQERTPSFGVNEDKQSFFCFGCHEGGNVIDLIMKVEGVEFTEALQIAAGDRELDQGFRLGKKVFANKVARRPEDKKVIRSGLRVPNKAVLFQPGKVPEKQIPWVYNPNSKKFSKWKDLAAVYEFRSIDNELMGYVLRSEWDVETPEGLVRKKNTPTVTWCEFEHEGKSNFAWALVKFGENGDLKPMLGQEKIIHSSLPVLLVEGEKASRAGSEMVNQADTTSWPGGTGGIVDKQTGKLLVDTRCILGKKKMYWPDADFGGFQAAVIWGAHCQAQDGMPFFIVDPPIDVPKGWDIADAQKEGWTEADILKHATNNLYSVEQFAQRYGLEVPDVSAIYPDAALSKPQLGPAVG